MHLLYRYQETISDGPGLRYSIYLAGCSHHCPGCHNPSSHDPMGGIELTEEVLRDIIAEINSNPLLDGITLSGGDPFFNPAELTVLLRRLRAETQLPILCYTGYTLEELLEKEECREALTLIDTLIDGRFVRELYDPNLPFRGSSNQRIIHLSDEKYQLIVRKGLSLPKKN
ncbi:anaerobic ribonucleoside-triphosphate reductase activating protein [Porphyromonas circumdentaria]|nr:anaerobic ribonucleoside-triphosphate reductase activating protein [Porphyromonas circumdentaria]